MRARRPPCIAGREPKPCLDAGPRPPLAFIHCRLDNPSPPLAPSLAGSDLPSQRRWLASMLRCRAAPTCTTPSPLPLPVAGWQARPCRAVAGWQAPLPLRCLAARTSLSLPAVAGWIPGLAARSALASGPLPCHRVHSKTAQAFLDVGSWFLALSHRSRMPLARASGSTIRANNDCDCCWSRIYVHPG